MFRLLAADLRPLKQAIRGHGWQPALTTQLVGFLLMVTLLVLGAVAEPPPRYPPLPLQMMTVMCLSLLTGVWTAVGAVVFATTIAILLLDGSLAESARLPCAVIAAGLLRQGVRPIVVTALLVAAALGIDRLRAPLTLLSLTADTVQASAALVATALAMLVLPRRSRYFPPRCRIHWDLLLFLPVVGIASAAAYALSSQHVEAANLLALMLLAHLAAFCMAWPLRKVMRDRNGKLRQWLFRQPGRNSVTASGLPEFATPLLPVARHTRRLTRHAERNEQQLYTTVEKVQRQDRALKECLRALRETTRLLSSTTQERETIHARWQALVEQSRDPMLICDERGRVKYANKAVVSALGMEPAALIGGSIEQLVPPSRLITHPLNFAAHEGAERERTAVAPILCARGREREFSIRVSRYDIADSTEYAVQLRSGDNTKQAMAALKRARTAVEEARRSRNAFNAAMSHELRTPLHGLIATLDILRDEPLSPAAMQRLAIAKASARSLLKIANDILDLSRMEGGDFTLENRAFSLKRLLEEALEESRAQANARGLQLATNFIGTFPPAFVGDSYRIRQIVVNLISNALKFTHQGGVQVKAQYDGRVCTIDVIDTGEGIPEDKHELIFEPFMQAHASAKHLGAGLGLSICRRLSQAMGGNLVLLCSGPDGTTFRLTLPLEVSEDAPPEETSLRIFNNPRGRILVVEDHPVNRYVVKGMLDVLECPTTLVGSGNEALELVQRQEFDLILMDCQMPGMDGFQTTREMRKVLTRHVPIIAMTANAMLDDRKRCLDAGMDDFLPKPFGRSALNEILCKWLDPEKQRKDARSRPDEPLDERIRKVPPLEPEVFEELWRNLKWQLPPMRRIGETFLNSVRQTDAMFADPGGGAMRRQAHTLLGTAGMIGARQIELIAAELQTAIKEKRWNDLEAVRAALRKAAMGFEREFSSRLSSPPGTSARFMDTTEL
jgi:PAS domain S-box-containing protein